MGNSPTIFLDKWQGCRLEYEGEIRRRIYLSCGRGHARRAAQEGIYDAAYPTSTPQNCMATSCPSGANVCKPENILKTKGRKAAFPPTKPENILKKSHLPKTVGIPKRHDKMSG
jgi:hypothetical protein